MRRCLELASNGMGLTAPNPMVGALLAVNDIIIGEGYHHASGCPHAEVEAVRSVKDQELLKSATLYVNLEPCNHVGKTPACTDLILQHGIPRVVIGHTDPNPLVAGTGIDRLRSNGVEVITGVMEKEGRGLNRRFLTFHEKKRPFIMLKWAQTRDGFIDLTREVGQQAHPAWITDEYCRTLVHKWRTEESAILVGTRTALLDDPALNVRAWSGKSPVRLVLDVHGSLPNHLKLFDGSEPTWVYTALKQADRKNIRYIRIDPEENDLDQLLQHLYENEIQSVIVEGGAELLGSFIQQKLWDEARIFTGPGSFGQGVAAPVLRGRSLQTMHTGNSILEIYRP